MSENDRPTFYDAVEDILPRDTLKATLESPVNAIYDEKATVFRCIEILQVEEDAGTVTDAMDAANRVMALFEMRDIGWTLKATAQKKTKAKTKAAPTNQVVMLANAQVGPSEQRPTVQGPQVHRQVGPMAQGPLVQGHNGTLGIDLGGRTRLPKPRSSKVIDEIRWASSQQLSLKEVAAQYKIPGDTELYYSRMCRVGQQALVDAIQTKTQSIYDARSAHQISRAKRKL